jgi:hypothetical protein
VNETPSTVGKNYTRARNFTHTKFQQPKAPGRTLSRSLYTYGDTNASEEMTNTHREKSAGPGNYKHASEEMITSTEDQHTKYSTQIQSASYTIRKTSSIIRACSHHPYAACQAVVPASRLNSLIAFKHTSTQQTELTQSFRKPQQVGDDDFNSKPREAPRASASVNWRLRNMNQNQNPASTKIWPIRFPEETNAWLPSVS